MACELPAEQGVPLSRWSSQELARVIAKVESRNSPRRLTQYVRELPSQTTK